MYPLMDALALGIGVGGYEYRVNTESVGICVLITPTVITETSLPKLF
jgi:hypothetical protein